MHAKTDSEVTSLAASSPTRSPRRPVYYVQSPSRDSHDGEKTTTSFHSTPVLSPMGSPPHSHSSLGRHSRESSSSRFSGSFKPGSRKMKKESTKPWKECAVIEEEGLLEDDDMDKGLPRRCYFLAFVLGFVFLFSIFSLILWGASRPQRPLISMKIKQFYQSRKTQRTMNVVILGTRIPLYGGGASWSSSTGNTNVPVPLNLSFVVRSRAYVLGKLVKPKFYIKVECSVVFDPTKLNKPVSLKNSCQYS